MPGELELAHALHHRCAVADGAISAEPDALAFSVQGRRAHREWRSLRVEGEHRAQVIGTAACHTGADVPSRALLSFGHYDVQIAGRVSRRQPGETGSDDGDVV
jgi:hypothetical protein